MRRNLLKPLALSILILFFCPRIHAQEIQAKQALDLVTKNASYLNLSSDDIQNVSISNAYFDKSSNTQLIYLQQTYKGIPVYNSFQVIVIKGDKVSSVSGNRISKMEEKVSVVKTIPSVSAARAVSSAAQSVNINLSLVEASSLSVLRTSNNNQKVEFGPSEISKENITSDLIWVPDPNGQVRLAWQVKILPKNTSDYWLIRVNTNDASVIGKDNLTVSCTWEKPQSRPNIFTVSSDQNINNNSKDHYSMEAPFAVSTAKYRVIAYPAESMNDVGGTPSLVNNPWQNAGTGNPATSLGWHNDGAADYNFTRGNNVWAKEDTAGKNGTGASAISLTASPDLDFDFAFNGNQQPVVGDNMKFAITNLFYWNNIMHDITYQYGFDEVSGNFQMSNQGRGGLGNDYVYADAQDGSSRNNANFSTPPDGSKPRMQMFLFDNPDKYNILKVNSPAALAGSMVAVEGAVSTKNLLSNVGPITGNVVLYNDDAGGTTHFACAAPANAASLKGNIALIDRGTCAFTDKIKNAQVAGAIGFILINNQLMDTLIIMGGADNTITIPAVSVSKTNGGKIKAAIAANNVVNVTLKTAPNDLDGDLDNSIIAHEYTHGISNRLTGGPAASTCLLNKEEMGEGWSDYYALMMTTNWATSSVNDGSKPRPIGTYVTGEDPVTGGGIRTYPYTTNMSVNKWTYSMLAGIANSETHDVGEIWTATLWDMTWNIIQTDGINANLYNANAAGGNSIALKLVTFAMKIQPCSPGFLDGRDAILKADDILYNGKYHCAIWSAFARRGMGVKAKQGSSDNTTDQTADFSTPSAAIVKLHVDKSMAAQNDNLTYTYNVKAQCASIGNYKIVDTLPSNVTYVSGGVYNASDRTVTFQIANVDASQSQDFTMKVRINSGTYFPTTTLFSETIPNNYIPFTLVAGTGSTWATSTVNHSAPYSVAANNNTGAASEQILSSLISYGISGHTQLSFWHNYNTEASHDGAVVELSVDNGTTWIDAGPYMSQNGYNSIINTNSNLTNKSAFSGSSSGFIQTIVNLSAFEGKSLKFRFRFVTDNSVASVGWYIDDISMTKEAAVYNLSGLYNNSGLLQNISDTVTIITSSALPIVWGDFTAEKIGKTALLKWNTLQEINTAKFSIERSGDGVHFTEIGSVNAAGNSNVNMNYTITDGTPLSGSNFYRIRQTDRDGKYLYSEIRSLTFDQVKGMITISPNPAKDHITISISGNKESRQVVLLNTAGQALATFTVKEESNYLKIPSLAAGVYYLKISGSTASSIQKLVIKK